MKTCYEVKDLDIKVEQYTNGLFRVTYGLQVDDKLDYVDACHKFGEDIFHALACESLLDNA